MRVLIFLLVFILLGCKSIEPEDKEIKLLVSDSYLSNIGFLKEPSTWPYTIESIDILQKKEKTGKVFSITCFVNGTYSEYKGYKSKFADTIKFETYKQKDKWMSKEIKHNRKFMSNPASPKDNF